MIRAQSAVQGLPTDQLLDLLQGDREYREQLDLANKFQDLGSNLENWVDDFKRQKGLGQGSRALKFDVDLKMLPSRKRNLSEDLEGTQKKDAFKILRGNQELSPEKLLKKTTQKEAGERILGKMTPKMLQAELNRRGVEKQTPKETIQGQQSLLIRDQDLKPQPNSQGFYSIRSGIVAVLQEKNSFQSNIKRIDIQTSKPVALPNINWERSNLYSNAPLQVGSLHLQDLDVKNLTAKEVNARTLSVNGNLIAEQIKTKGLTGVNGRAEITQWRGDSFVATKNAQLTSFEGDKIRVSGNLTSLRGQTKKLSVNGNLSVSGPLKITQEANVIGKAHAGKLTTLKNTKITGDSLLQIVAKSQGQQISPSPKQGHKL